MFEQLLDIIKGQSTDSIVQNPDILAWISQLPQGRPDLVVGFAAETDNVLENASAKRLRKGCDWIVANDVTPTTGIMGGTENMVTLISDAGAESWPRLSKTEVARRLLRLLLRDRVLEPARDLLVRDVLLLRDPGGEDVRVAMLRP